MKFTSIILFIFLLFSSLQADAQAVVQPEVQPQDSLSEEADAAEAEADPAAASGNHAGLFLFQQREKNGVSRIQFLGKYRYRFNYAAGAAAGRGEYLCQREQTGGIT